MSHCGNRHGGPATSRETLQLHNLEIREPRAPVMPFSQYISNILQRARHRGWPMRILTTSPESINRPSVQAQP